MKPLSEVAPVFWSFRFRSKQCEVVMKTVAKCPYDLYLLYSWRMFHLYYCLLAMNLQHSPKSSTLLVMGEYSNWGSWSNMTMSLTLESMHSGDPNWGLSINFWHFTYPLDSTTFASTIRHHGLKSFLKQSSFFILRQIHFHKISHTYYWAILHQFCLTLLSERGYQNKTNTNVAHYRCIGL